MVLDGGEWRHGLAGGRGGLSHRLSGLHSGVLSGADCAVGVVCGSVVWDRDLSLQRGGLAGGGRRGGARYPAAWIPAWNALILLAFFLVVVGILSTLRKLQSRLEERVRERTVALRAEMAERERLEREILEISERERQRIGQDLHDVLCQHLTATALAGEVLAEKLEAHAVPEATDAKRVVDLVEDGITLARNLAHGLTPVSLPSGGLREALQELAAGVSKQSRIECRFNSTARAWSRRGRRPRSSTGSRKRRSPTPFGTAGPSGSRFGWPRAKAERFWPWLTMVRAFRTHCRRETEWVCASWPPCRHDPRDVRRAPRPQERHDRYLHIAMNKKRVFLVDDHPLVREWLTNLINQQSDLAVCGEAEDAPRALQAISAAEPDVAIVDLSLAGGSGIELIKDLKQLRPNVAVIVLSMHDELLYAERALRAGARGYIMKRESTKKIVSAIREVLGGSLHVSEAVSASMA